MFMLIYKDSNIDFLFCSRFDYYQAPKAFLRSFFLIYFIATSFQTHNVFLIVFSAERSTGKNWERMQVRSQRGHSDTLKCWDALILQRLYFTNYIFAKTSRWNYKCNTASKVLSHLLQLPLDFHLILYPQGLGGLLVFWHYSYSCFSMRYLPFVLMNEWSGVVKCKNALNTLKNKASFST